jgi:hypothetical protein
MPPRALPPGLSPRFWPHAVLRGYIYRLDYFLPWGADPCALSFVASRFLCLPPSSGATWPYLAVWDISSVGCWPLCSILVYTRFVRPVTDVDWWLVLSCSLLCRSISCSYPRGSESRHRGPLVLGQASGFFIFSVSDRMYGLFLLLCSAQSFALGHRTPSIFGSPLDSHTPTALKSSVPL